MSSHRLVPALFGVLLPLSLSACDGDDKPASPPPVANAGAAGAGTAGTGTALGGAGSSGAHEDGGGAATPVMSSLGEPCQSDANCDDGLFCNGRERCLPTVPGGDLRVCMAPEFGPCSPDACDEEANACDCRDGDGDKDGDGFRVEGCVLPGEPHDCDDTNEDRNPARPEVCNPGAPSYDEDCNDATYGGKEADTDDDGFVSAECFNYARYQVMGGRPDQRRKGGHGQDCHDDDRKSHPNAPEVCDGKDNNCNGEIDEVAGVPPEERNRYYRDADGDLFGDPDEVLLTACQIPPPGYVHQAGDCNDESALESPGRPEICNGVDDNCDKKVDEPSAPGALMLDEPFDGVTQFKCDGTKGWKIDECPPGRLNCGDQDYLDGCETIGTTLCNCHDCGVTCQFSCGDERCAEIQAASTGRNHTCFLVQSGPDDDKGRVACTGYNLTGQLGLGTTKNADVAALVPDLVGATNVAVGNWHSCAVVGETGVGYCWGSNEFGQLGSGTNVTYSVYPVPLFLPSRRVAQVAAGAFHGCALLEETGEVGCWGKGDKGQLGNGYEDDLRSPSLVIRLIDYEVVEFNDVTSIAAGSEHTCALLASHEVECWGSNQFMQLGVEPGLLSFNSTPIPVPGLEGLSVEELAAASVNTCVRAGHDVYCWGGNIDHQLVASDEPFDGVTRIPLPESSVGIAVGPLFACALSATGAVYCWGTNLAGERGTLGDPPIEPTLVPLSGVKKIFAGAGNQLCALKLDGSVWCWGRGDFGQLGNGRKPLRQPTATRVSAIGSTQGCSVETVE